MLEIEKKTTATEMIPSYAELEDDAFETTTELDRWIDELFDEVSVCDEVAPGIWHIVGTNYNGEPFDHHFWEDFDDYVMVKAGRPE